MDQKSMLLNAMDHAAGLCCMSTVKAADCAPPIKFIHAVNDSCAGYFFRVNACMVHMDTLSSFISWGKIIPFFFFFFLATSLFCYISVHA